MTVLHILDHSLPILSGYSIRSRNILAFQKKLGLRPVVLTSPKHGSARNDVEQYDGVPYYRAAMIESGLGRVPFIREAHLMACLARRIVEVARAEGAQILHAHSPLLNGLPALWAGRWLGLPLVYEVRAFWEDAAVDHGTVLEGSFRYRLSRGLETFLLKRVDQVVTLGEAMRQEILERGVERKRLSVVPNGVDPEWFHPIPRNQALAHRLGLDGGPVLGFIGSFYHYEGLRFLLEALPALLKRLPGVRLLLVGGGREEPALRSLATGLGNTVVFTGPVPYAEVREFYSLMDIFVCPRRRMRLTELVTPLKPLEAMAMARPVLASDVGGLAELIQHEVTGLLFQAESRESFIEAAMRLGSNPVMGARLGEEARASVVRERGWREIASRYLPVYDGMA